MAGYWATKVAFITGVCTSFLKHTKGSGEDFLAYQIHECHMADIYFILLSSSSGIGAATAIKYARLGAKVALHGRNVEKLNGVAKQCLAAGLTEDKVSCSTDYLSSRFRRF